MVTPATTNVWDALDNPEVKTGPMEYWGQVQIDSYFCVLRKGVGKIPFDPQQHNIDQRRTAIEIVIIPLAEQNISYDVNRSMIAESREWAGIVLPSIKALGLSARELNGKWARIRTKETGSTYVNSNGETRERTTFEFMAVYNSEDECRTAYQAFAAGAGTQPATNSAPAAQPTNGNGNGNSNGNKERETALKFLRVIVENAVRGQTDLNVINNTVAANISNMPMVAKYFTADSPETMNLIAEAMAK